MANVSWCRQRMTFRWAYRKKEAVAAQGSNSAALGVMLGAGGGRWRLDVLLGEKSLG